MPVALTWNRNSPVSSDNPQQGANEIANVKKTVDERARNGGHMWEPDATASTTNAGRHSTGVEFTDSGTGALAGEFYIYGDDGTTKLVTVRSTAAAASAGVDLLSTVTTATVSVRNLSVLGNETIAGNLTVTGTSNVHAINATGSAHIIGSMTVDGALIAGGLPAVSYETNTATAAVGTATAPPGTISTVTVVVPTTGASVLLTTNFDLSASGTPDVIVYLRHNGTTFATRAYSNLPNGITTVNWANFLNVRPTAGSQVSATYTVGISKGIAGTATVQADRQFVVLFQPGT